MARLLTWLNVSVATLNVTLQLLVIYRFSPRYLLISREREREREREGLCINQKSY